MLTLRYPKATVELDAPKITQILTLLGIAASPDIARFLKINLPEERIFYHLMAQILNKDGLGAVMITNHHPSGMPTWEPVNVFYQLGRFMKEDIKLIKDADNKQYEAYDITFSVNGVQDSVTADVADPSQLFEALNKHLKTSEFIRLVSHYEQRHKVEWLLVPKPFDLDTLKKLTGCNTAREAWQPSLAKRFTKGRNYPPKISLVHKLDKKVLFIPEILYPKSYPAHFLVFKDKNDSKEYEFTGQVLPGETLNDGIGTLLIETLSYDGIFEYRDATFLDYEADEDNKKIERYTVTVVIKDELEATETSDGLQIVMETNPPRYR